MVLGQKYLYGLQEEPGSAQDLAMQQETDLVRQLVERHDCRSNQLLHRSRLYLVSDAVIGRPGDRSSYEVMCIGSPRPVLLSRHIVTIRAGRSAAEAANSRSLPLLTIGKPARARALEVVSIMKDGLAKPSS